MCNDNNKNNNGNNSSSSSSNDRRFCIYRANRLYLCTICLNNIMQ